MTWEAIVNFCRGYGLGYTVVACDRPSDRPDAVGMCGATERAQLCADRVVAAVPDVVSLHCISHEIGHSEAAALHGHEASFGEERGVTVEQIAFLVRFSRYLMDGGADVPAEALRTLLDASAMGAPSFRALSDAADALKKYDRARASRKRV